MGRINIELDDAVHRKAKAVCALREITLIEFVNQALKEKIAKEKI